MPGEGPASTTLSLAAKKDVDVGAKPRHDGIRRTYRGLGITVDKFFLGKGFIESPDGHGGTLFQFQNGTHHFIPVDLPGEVSASIIQYA
jgi:hypothetical protein